MTSRECDSFEGAVRLKVTKMSAVRGKANGEELHSSAFTL